MATKKSLADKFRERLDGLSAAIPEDLRLPSLEENRLEGYAYLFRLVLPLLNAKGKRVFTDAILDELFQVLDDRFGGCMVASSSSAYLGTSGIPSIALPGLGDRKVGFMES